MNRTKDNGGKGVQMDSQYFLKGGGMNGGVWILKGYDQSLILKKTNHNQHKLLESQLITPSYLLQGAEIGGDEEN